MNLFELFATITLDDSGYKKGLGDAVSHTSKLSDSIKSGLATAAKVGTAAIAAAATGIAALTKASVDNYAEYEQLVGGVDTLFKESSQKVQEYAANAYKTAGMSANEYMETVTSFSASLLQSLEGDTEAATEAANQAIVDMSDNANKMGTDISLIQNAYQGFAKQNYSMLDNLKLGYGGTASEMHRLLEDAAAMNEEFAQTAEYSMDEKGHLEVGYADVLKAINIVQTEMGITGTTAKEASETISGSMAAAKAAWSNLVTGVADDNADFGKLISNFVNSVSTAAKNLVPRVKTAIVGIGQLISQTLPIIVNEIPAIIKDVVPDLLNAAMDLVSAIGQGLLDNADSLLSSALDLVTTLVDFIIQGLPSVLTATLQIIQTIGNGLIEYAPKLITSVADVIIKLADMLTNPEQLQKLLDVGLTLISTVGQALIDNVEKITEKIPEIVQNLVDVFLNPEQIGKVIDMGVSLLTALISNTAEIISVIVNQIPVVIDGIVNAFTNGDNLEKIIAAGVDLFVSIISNTGEIIRLIAEKIPEITGSIVTAFAEVDWSSVGKDIMNGIIDGIIEVMKLAGDLPTMLSNWITGAEYGDINYKMTTKDFENQMEWENASWQERYEAQQKATGGTVINQNNYFTGDSTIMGQKKALDEMMAAIQAQQ